MKYIIHVRSVCHVTHLLEVEAESEDDAIEAYDEGECDTNLIGVQIGDNVDFLDSDPTTADVRAQGDYIPVPEPHDVNVPLNADTKHALMEPEQPVYEVTLWEKVTYTAEVRADSEEEAKEIVEEMVCQGEIDGVSQGYSARIVNEQK